MEEEEQSGAAVDRDRKEEVFWFCQSNLLVGTFIVLLFAFMKGDLKYKIKIDKIDLNLKNT